ncbi:MAG: hypothetical protein ACKVHT_10205 [Flavobacteriales bacterium]
MKTINNYINTKNSTLLYLSYGVVKGFILTMPIAFVSAHFEYFKVITNFLIHSI